ncbi:acetylcholinesterase [Dermacentor silvarum]|uniref:acetylcholinesterase n=1 Tax=Dermacentor silvarum TaxID=543639 RepID=UPI001899701A|nr:acetylcholinesterase [Dermacentor silvarum]
MDPPEKQAGDKSPASLSSRHSSRSVSYKRRIPGSAGWKGRAKDKRSKERSENDSKADTERGSAEYSRKVATFAFRVVVFTAIVVVIVIAAILLRHRDAAATTVASKDSSSTQPNEELGGTTGPSVRTTATESSESTSTSVGAASEVPRISTPEVITTVGKLKGGAVDVYGVRLHRWLGVPYAQLGTGSKRFAPAQPAAKASSRIALGATEWSPPCAQLVNDTLFGREDCLRLNVWAPAQRPASAATRPLLLAMTQDWFSRGSNNLPEWEQLAARVGAVLMSPNVRLGVLGFLGHTSSAELDADLAIKDAVIAVRWALDNAAVFHADPSRLMLVAHGSGAYVLTAVAQALNLSCLRAVLEGPVLGSVLPTNTASS